MIENMNMYGCPPCPECGSRYRCVFNDKPGFMQCDDCGHEEKTTAENYEYFKEHK